MIKYMFPNGKYTYFSDRQFMILVDGGVEYTFKE